MFVDDSANDGRSLFYLRLILRWVVRVGFENKMSQGLSQDFMDRSIQF